jgi:putative two-component system response regulator
VRLFTHFGCDADAASGGQAALDHLLHPPDGPTASLPALVILDLMMPDIDGMEVLRRLRNAPATAALPVVMYSAVSDTDVKAQALREGAAAFFVKGNVDADDLRALVERYAAKA